MSTAQTSFGSTDPLSSKVQMGVNYLFVCLCAARTNPDNIVPIRDTNNNDNHIHHENHFLTIRIVRLLRTSAHLRWM